MSKCSDLIHPIPLLHIMCIALCSAEQAAGKNKCIRLLGLENKITFDLIQHNFELPI